MKEKADKKYYLRNFEIGIIVSQIIIILLFLIIPFPTDDEPLQFVYTEPFVKLIDIPASQQKPASSIPKPPRPPVTTDMFQYELSDELLEDIEVDEVSIFDDFDEGDSDAGIFDSFGAIKSNSLPYIPRQLLVALPNHQDSDIDGIIKFLVLVDEKGLPVDHQILINSLKCEDCLDSIIKAVYKSKWQPVTYKGEKKKFWIEKTFEF